MNLTVEVPAPGPVPLPVGVSADYHLRLAETAAEVRAAQELRFQVFNLELGNGLEASYRTGLDRDPFDAVCDHLVVYHNRTGELAGTYRLQTGEAAGAALGYYSEQEFDFSPFERLRPRMIELGRACVHRRHRNLSALGVLWKGIAGYARERNGRYLIGCSSLAAPDPGAAWPLYAQLRARHLAPPERRASPRPGRECPRSETAPGAGAIPKLMQAYLGLGAEVCGAPAWDPEFGTIDFLTLLDLEALPPAAKRRFLE
jgi:putative hemolysin